MSTRRTQYGLITGSGFREFGSRSGGQLPVTEFGEPSSAIRELEYGKRRVFLIARHGDALAIPAHRVNYRANMLALSRLGVQAVIALNTVGVIGREPDPGGLAVPDQLIDYTWGRDHSIHDGKSHNLEPFEVHQDFTEPFSASLRLRLLEAAGLAGVACRDGGVYAVTQGPRLETAAEVDRLERDGADYIGMTAMPEASLARELDMQYACLSLVVNRAAGRGDTSIHEDLEAHTAAARLLAMRILRQFFHETG